MNLLRSSQYWTGEPLSSQYRTGKPLYSQYRTGEPLSSALSAHSEKSLLTNRKHHQLLRHVAWVHNVSGTFQWCFCCTTVTLYVCMIQITVCMYVHTAYGTGEKSTGGEPCHRSCKYVVWEFVVSDLVLCFV